MKKIDFSKVQIFTGVSHKASVVQDIREPFADAMYQRCIGLPAHALAMKIYNSKGEEEYNEQECEIIRQCAENFWSPSIIDAVLNLIK